MRQILYLISLFLCLFAATSEAVIYTDNFEYPQPSVSVWTSADGIFTHTMSDDAIWGIDGETNQRMIPTEGTYTITFNLLPGQSVDFIGFDYTINDLWSTSFDVYTPGAMNTFGIYYDSPFSAFDSDLWGLSEYVYGAYSMIFHSPPDMDVGLTLDNISIHVVPEPSSIILLGLGSLTVRRNKHI